MPLLADINVIVDGLAAQTYESFAPLLPITGETVRVTLSLDDRRRARLVRA